MLRSVDLKDYMLTNPISINGNASLFDAVHLILFNKVSGLCVVDSDGVLVGILSELDCLKGILASTYNQSGVGQVAEYMTPGDLDVAHSDDNIVKVAMDMLDKGRRRRPVVDEDNKLVGQITCRQILRAVKDFTLPNDPTENSSDTDS